MLISVEETIPVRAIVRRAMVSDPIQTIVHRAMVSAPIQTTVRRVTVSVPIQTTVRRAIRAVPPSPVNLYAVVNPVNLVNSVNPVILETLVSLPSPIRHQVGIVSSADKSISKLSLIESS